MDRNRETVRISELDAAANKIHGRCNDLGVAAPEQSSESLNIEKQETAVSRCQRARTRAAKIGKGLSKDDRAQKLARQHWLEAIDPRHRYGRNLHCYYDHWFGTSSTEPFFYWLDVGDGKDIDLKQCPRDLLRRECIIYLGPKEREAFEVIVEDGKLVHKQTGMLVSTSEGSKWIFVFSPSRSLYVGKKKKGIFKHSSFLSGGAVTAAGRLVAHNGVLEAIWPHTTYYRLSEDRKEFLSFLRDHQVDLTNVKSSDLISYGDQPHQLYNRTIIESPKLTPDSHVISGEWTFLITGLCLEILSISFDQAASPSKPQYALFGMILAIAALLICIWELVYKGKKEGVVLRRWGRYLWWFYYPHSTQLFGTLPDFYGLIGSTVQCFCSTIQYVWFSHHADNPIKVSLWPAIFLVCLGAKRLAENQNESNGRRD
ncbi:IQ domain-containing protein IQM1 [Pyrus x bretschneideri]|uniref:IQ domain-containing protein IQM1 n=1 Tax=Pyrus x bretschneideri TaxID=225117 RepID=UPI00202FA832|nr:IQ domain-containing protein IQM1 [Pyrus x bretschneideri]